MGYDYSKKGRRQRKGDDLKLIWLMIVGGGGFAAILIYFVVTK